MRVKSTTNLVDNLTPICLFQVYSPFFFTINLLISWFQIHHAHSFGPEGFSFISVNIPCLLENVHRIHYVNCSNLKSIFFAPCSISKLTRIFTDVGFVVLP